MDSSERSTLFSQLSESELSLLAKHTDSHITQQIVGLIIASPLNEATSATVIQQVHTLLQELKDNEADTRSDYDGPSFVDESTEDSGEDTQPYIVGDTEDLYQRLDAEDNQSPRHYLSDGDAEMWLDVFKHKIDRRSLSLFLDEFKVPLKCLLRQENPHLTFIKEIKGERKYIEFIHHLAWAMQMHDILPVLYSTFYKDAEFQLARLLCLVSCAENIRVDPDYESFIPFAKQLILARPQTGTLVEILKEEFQK